MYSLFDFFMFLKLRHIYLSEVPDASCILYLFFSLRRHSTLMHRARMQLSTSRSSRAGRKPTSMITVRNTPQSLVADLGLQVDFRSPSLVNSSFVTQCSKEQCGRDRNMATTPKHSFTIRQS